MVDEADDGERFKQNKKFHTAEPAVSNHPCARLQTAKCDALGEACFGFCVGLGCVLLEREIQQNHEGA